MPESQVKGKESSRAAAGSSAIGESHRFPFPLLLVSLSIVFAIAACYYPVAFNFFNGDDFVHLTWLPQAVANPELIWRNFHSSWLDGTTTRFYRPLISVFMVSDYLVWGINGLGFRLTNMIFLGLTAFFLFLVIKDLEGLTEAALDKGSAARAGFSTWAFFAAILFAVYPLHPEAVSWVTGRVDSIVTLFCVASIWFYMRWRVSGSSVWCILSGIAMILGLLSKEMAVTLPAIFVAYELMGISNSPVRFKNPTGELERDTHEQLARRQTPGLGSRIKTAILASLIFWLILAVYFAVRLKALGTFVGGYDDSLFFISDLKNFAYGWLNGMRMTLVPINKDLLGSHHILTKSWEVVLVLTAILASARLWTNRKMLKPVAFIVIWLGLSLAPVYKIFAIAGDLQGSRLAYLATVPLCALLAFAAANSNLPLLPGKHKTTVALLNGFLLLGLAGSLLWINNQAWAEAGAESNQIRQGLSKFYTKTTGDPQVLISGLPDQINGAYVSRNALWGMTKRPQLHRDIYNALMINSYEPILPFGFLKDSLWQNRKQVRLLRWGNNDFEEICLTESPNVPVCFQKNLKNLISLTPKPGVSYGWTKEGHLDVTGGRGFKGRPELLVNPGKTPCWSVEFIGVVLEPRDSDETEIGLDLLYTNDMLPEFELKNRTHGASSLSATGEMVILPLRSLTDWAMGGNNHQLKLLLPPERHLLIKEIKILPAARVMPVLTFANSGFLGSKGYLHISANEPEQDVAVNAQAIEGARGIILNLTRPNLLFENQNTQVPSKLIMKSFRLDGTKGSIKLSYKDFPKPGIYEARIWALDKDGNRKGVASDHIVVSVD